MVLLNGSPHTHGCTARALEEVAKTLRNEGIVTELIQIGKDAVHGCISCGYCSTHDGCVFNTDKVNEVAAKFETADGLVIGSPVYYASPNGTAISFMNRLFYSTGFSKQMKVGASVVSCRRGGNTSAFDVLNKYFTISGMPVVSSTYWNQDLEGLQTMRNLGRNMAFLIRAIAAEKEKSSLPEAEHSAFTSFPDGK